MKTGERQSECWRNPGGRPACLAPTGNLSVTTAEVRRRSPRIGLLEGRTGVPVFLLSLPGAAEIERVELTSAGDVEERVRGSAHPEDRLAWETCLPFFAAEGTRALVHVSPANADTFASLVGEDRGLAQRTGLAALPLYREVADVLVVPQASRWLEGERHRNFHVVAFERLSQDPHFFFLADLPLAQSGEDARAWQHGLTSPDTAVLYPWLCREHEIVAPSVVAAAALQRSDERFGIHRLPSNQPIAGGFLPLRRQSPAELATLVGDRLTVFHRFSQGPACLWGGATLAARGDDEARFLSTRRTLLAVREAVHRICEPFVLEPLLPGIEKAVDVALESAFEPLRKFFSNTTKQALTTAVRIERGMHTGNEDVLVIDVQCRLPYALGEVSFRLGMAA